MQRPLEQCGWKKEKIHQGERFTTCGYVVSIRNNMTFIDNTDNSKYSKHVAPYVGAWIEMPSII